MNPLILTAKIVKWREYTRKHSMNRKKRKVDKNKRKNIEKRIMEIDVYLLGKYF